MAYEAGRAIRRALKWMEVRHVNYVVRHEVNELPVLVEAQTAEAVACFTGLKQRLSNHEAKPT
jgi:hypothetical protein